MKPEVWVAIYAAVVGSCALLLNFKTWLDSGVKLKLSLISNGIVIGGDEQFDERDLVIVTVINRGDEPTMITSLCFFEIPSWWRRIRFRPIKSYVVTNPQLKGYPPNVPSELAPSKSWRGVIRKRADDLPLDLRAPNLETGNFYVGVYTTNRDRPYLIHIPMARSSQAIKSQSADESHK